MKRKFAERDARILELAGTMHAAEIAYHVGVTYAVVASVIWRAKHLRRPTISPRRIRALGAAAAAAGLTVQDIRAFAVRGDQ